MTVKAGYLLLAGGGAVVIWSGVRGKPVTTVFRSLIGGDNPAKVKETQNISGVTPTSGNVSPIPPTPGVSLAPASQTGNNIGPGNITTPAQARGYAFALFPQYGWSSAQKAFLFMLWTQESGWNADAVNPSSGAYGIPQCLPSVNGHPYPSGWVGAGQSIVWGLNYIKGRYGSPGAAWAHETANNWY